MRVHHILKFSIGGHFDTFSALPLQHLNRVELQNGCLSLAHANLFIPSNLHGSCFDPSTGKVDNERLKRNMDTAADIYISRTNAAPCADSSTNQELRADLNTFLKGTVVRKEQLKRENPDRWAAMEVWNIRRQHMVGDFPPQYVFYQKCCFAPKCEHPLCQRSSHPLPTWYPGGPSLNSCPYQSRTQHSRGAILLVQSVQGYVTDINSLQN